MNEWLGGLFEISKGVSINAYDIDIYCDLGLDVHTLMFADDTVLLATRSEGTTVTLGNLKLIPQKLK